MTDQASEQDLLNILRYMAAAWPQFDMSEQTVAVYVIQLLRRGHAADVLLLAAMNLVDISTWFPTVAHLQEEAERILREREAWLMTANYRLDTGEIPNELVLPPRLQERVLGIPTADHRGKQ